MIMKQLMAIKKRMGLFLKCFVSGEAMVSPIGGSVFISFFSSLFIGVHSLSEACFYRQGDFFIDDNGESVSRLDGQCGGDLYPFFQEFVGHVA